MSSLSSVRLTFAISLIAGCAVLRGPLEADPVTHMLVQLPALAWAGWLFADIALSHGRDRPVSDFNAGGVAGLLVVLFGVAFWMLPRSIDGALTSPTMEIAKFITVPLLIGAPLRCSWSRAHPLLRGFLMSNALSMLGVLAWLYTAAPIRVCNSYLVSDQQRLGMAFLFVALGLALAWGGRLFFAPRAAATSFADPELDGSRLP